MRPLGRFSEQFRKPSGFWGHVAGMLMAATTASRNRWTLSLLDVRPDDRVLEIGYGPGVGIALASRMVEGGTGTVTGIDPSDVMRAQAQRRNGRAMRKGKVHLVTGAIEEWPGFPHTFTKIFAVNSAQFWTDPATVLRKLHGWLEPEGRIAITYQPVGKNAPAPGEFARQLSANLTQAGFTRIRQETKDFKVGLAVCVVAEKGRS